MNNAYDMIAESIINGQFRQAAAQMQGMGDEYMPEMLKYFAIDLDDKDLAVKAASVYFMFSDK